MFTTRAPKKLVSSIKIVRVKKTSNLKSFWSTSWPRVSGYFHQDQNTVQVIYAFMEETTDN